MALTKGSVNALNVIGARRLSFIPDHFAKMIIGANANLVDQWVYQNLNSRYAIVKSLKLDDNNKMVEVQELGVEDPKELTMLSLTCPHLEKTI